MRNNKDDIIGQRFGNLTVLDFDHIGNNGSAYLCLCDCGNEKVIARVNLITGNSTSCGCKKKGPRSMDLIGQRFGRLEVIDFDHMAKYGKSYWLCLCDCGNEIIVSRTHLLDGHITSCGCWNREHSTRHGMCDTSLHNIWVGMRQRCSNPNGLHYRRYGGRGIEVCDEWDTFENFKEWADESGYKQGLSIDRINNDDGYYPNNCRWADSRTQANNKSTNRYITYAGNTHTIAEWSRILNVNYSTLRQRINNDNMIDFENYYGG